MGTVLGSLQVNVDANTSKFSAGMAKGSKSLAGLSSQMGATAKVAKTFVGTLAGLASVGAFVAMLKHNLELIDGLGKTADKLGTTTEALVGLQHAADQTGLGASGLTTALEQMTRRVSEAAQGTGTAKRALEALNLSARQLTLLRPDQALYVIADAMVTVKNQADRVRIAYDLFGRSGISMVNTLAKGSAGLAAFQADAEKLGLTLSRDQVAQVEAANDAIDRLGKAFAGAARQITAGLAANIKVFADDLTDATIALRDSRNNLGGIGELLEPENVGLLQDAADAVGRLFKAGQGSVVAGLGDFGTVLKNLGFDQVGGSLEAAGNNAIKGIRDTFDYTKNPLPSARADALRQNTSAAAQADAEQKRVQQRQLQAAEEMERHLAFLRQQAEYNRQSQGVVVRF